MTRETMGELAEMCKSSVSDGLYRHRMALERMEGMARCLYSLGMVEDAGYVRQMMVESDAALFRKMVG